MQLCHRCGSKPASVTFADMNVCPLCASSLAWKFGRTKHAAGAEGERTLLDRVTDPLNFGISPADPLGIVQGTSEGAQKAGHDLFGVQKTISDTSRTVKIVAVAGAVIGVSAIALVLWNAHRTQVRAFHFVEQHPEVMRAAMV